MTLRILPDNHERGPYYERLPKLDVGFLRRMKPKELDESSQIFLSALTTSLNDLDYALVVNLVDTMAKRDEYAGLLREQGSDIHTGRQLLDECFSRSDESIQLISSLWETAALLMRTFYKFPIRVKNTTLWRVLKHVHDVGSNYDLLSHTEFYVITNSQGHQMGHYRSGSVLRKLKSYRNTSVHTLSMRTPVTLASYGEIMGLACPNFDLHDPVYNERVVIDVPTLDGLVNLAEEAYSHFVRGYEIMEARMLKDSEDKLIF